MLQSGFFSILNHFYINRAKKGGNSIHAHHSYSLIIVNISWTISKIQKRPRENNNENFIYSIYAKCVDWWQYFHLWNWTTCSIFLYLFSGSSQSISKLKSLEFFAIISHETSTHNRLSSDFKKWTRVTKKKIQKKKKIQTRKKEKKKTARFEIKKNRIC